MPDAVPEISLLAAVLATGLSAGLFHAFFYAIMPALRRTGDHAFVTVMQHINRVILNAWFAACFAGAPLFSLVAVISHLGAPWRPVLPWAVAGLVLNVAMVAVTIAANVPRNERLDRAGDPDTIADLAAVRAEFERPWVRWNTVRTALNIAAFGCLAWALLLHGRLTGG
ncbi:membrane protein [Sphaerisporangium rufum]|uniref:Membrane protein n=1 Tax=Sphaerisporangium rufum TaxID=1381558 RepID=A0A919R1H5_9ACTN|nr:anthrone oxygenase family protein [Sphaerisporangium rufum]GII76681.1 membrane protein [Sphaerisporangium rufum]